MTEKMRVQSSEERPSHGALISMTTIPTSPEEVITLFEIGREYEGMLTTEELAALKSQVASSRTEDNPFGNNFGIEPYPDTGCFIDVKVFTD